MSRPTKYPLLAACLVFLIAALAGCGGTDRFRVMERKAENPSRPVRVMVRDFADERPREEKSYVNFARVPLNVYGGYFFYDRHDNKFPTQSLPFSQLVAERLAERLDQVRMFDEVSYVPLDQTPELGDFDVELRGTMRMLRTRGRIHYYGLSIFGDYLHYTSLPKFVRRWEIDFVVQLFDAYTGEPIAEPKEINMITRRSSFSIYKNRGQTADLEKNLVPALDEYITAAWESLPARDAAKWAELRDRGARVIAAREAEARATALSRQPRFRFLSPTDGDSVRGSSVSLRWDAVAPGKLRSVLLVANNESVGLGINPLDLVSADTAPSEVQPREVNVPLRLGENRLEALVEDHIGQQSRASITLNRIPQPLTPARRYALLIGSGATAEAGLSSISSTLTDPMVGQFAAGTVTTATGSMNADAVRARLNEFGSRPVAGDLVLLYVSGSGNWENGTILDGVPVADFLSAASAAIATENAILLLDIDWGSQAGDEDLMAKFQLESQLRAGWALMAAQSTGGRAIEAGGSRLFATHLVEVLRGVGSDALRLTVERFLDELVIGYEQKSNKASLPDIFGRYNRNNTMVERQ